MFDPSASKLEDICGDRWLLCQVLVQSSGLDSLSTNSNKEIFLQDFVIIPKHSLQKYSKFWKKYFFQHNYMSKELIWRYSELYLLLVFVISVNFQLNNDLLFEINPWMGCYHLIDIGNIKDTCDDVNTFTIC